jgi:hypothetical protein
VKETEKEKRRGREEVTRYKNGANGDRERERERDIEN